MPPRKQPDLSRIIDSNSATFAKTLQSAVEAAEELGAQRERERILRLLNVPRSAVGGAPGPGTTDGQPLTIAASIRDSLARAPKAGLRPPEIAEQVSRRLGEHVSTDQVRTSLKKQLKAGSVRRLRRGSYGPIS